MKNFFILFYAFVILGGYVDLVWGEICKQWGTPKLIGRMDVSQIPEASGIAASKKIKNRLYHVNDSGNGHRFLITDLNGKNTQSVQIDSTIIDSGPHPLDDDTSDYEDLSLGPCFEESSCLFIADIGDNRGFGNSSIRETIQILVIKEENNMPARVRPLRQIVLSYPDGPHDAEGLAVHPNGDIFILTKEMRIWGWKALPAGMYKLGRQQWEQSQEETFELTKIGKLDIPKWVKPHSSLFGKVVTGLDISPDGTQFMVLTYDFAINIFQDLSDARTWISKDLREGKDYLKISLLSLPQPEGITYLSGSKSFMYHTEYSEAWFRLIRGQGLTGYSPGLVRVDCADS